MDEADKTIVKILLRVGLGILLVTLLFGSFTIISTGQRGVKMRLGVIKEVLVEGLHFKVPLIDKIVKMDVQTQKEEVEVSAASKDLQTVSSKIALNYHLEEGSVNLLWQKIGKDYKQRIVDPSIQEAVKSTTAKYTAEELITKRELVKEEAKLALKERLKNEFIIVDDLSIVNFDFSVEFNKAIESKQTAVQDALRAENDLRRIKTEAEQRVAQAQAEAQAIRLQSEAANNDKYVSLKALEVQLKAVEKWNGVLPSQMVPGGSVPFVNLTK